MLQRFVNEAGQRVEEVRRLDLAMAAEFRSDGSKDERPRTWDRAEAISPCQISASMSAISSRIVEIAHGRFCQRRVRPPSGL